jgi:methionyl-tRNA formyltransferase
MKYSFALVIGEAIGLRCFKRMCNIKNIKIKFVISSDKKYDSAVKNICKRYKIKFLKKKNSLNKSLSCDYLISIFSNLIIKEKYLKMFKFGCFNFHPAILPFYPGINPISGMIFNGEKNIGVTLHKMTKKIDGGNIILLKKTSITDDYNLIQCMKKIEKLTLKILNKFILTIKNNKKLKEQLNDYKKKKKFPKTIPNNGKINYKWNLTYFKRNFNAGYAGPYKSTWGKIYFLYSKKKKFINNFYLTEKTLKKKLQKSSENVFYIKLKNKVIKVETSDN